MHAPLPMLVVMTVVVMLAVVVAGCVVLHIQHFEIFSGLSMLLVNGELEWIKINLPKNWLAHGDGNEGSFNPHSLTMKSWLINQPPKLNKPLISALFPAVYVWGGGSGLGWLAVMNKTSFVSFPKRQPKATTGWTLRFGRKFQKNHQAGWLIDLRTRYFPICLVRVVGKSEPNIFFQIGGETRWFTMVESVNTHH